MRDVPFVGIFATDARQIGTGTLGAPLERVVVHALGRERVMAVALDFIAQRADHLRVTEVTALADIDVASGEFERRVRPDAIDFLDRALEIEQRSDLDETADGDHHQDSRDQDDRVLFEDLVP